MKFCNSVEYCKSIGSAISTVSLAGEPFASSLKIRLAFIPFANCDVAHSSSRGGGSGVCVMIVDLRRGIMFFTTLIKLHLFAKYLTIQK